jgi:hypothetical protein
MTVIAWDGRMVAADSLITVGDTRVGYADKVVLKRFRDGSALYAATGPDGWLDAWIAWDVAGQIPGDRPSTSLPSHRTGVIIRWMDGECHSLTPEHPYWGKCDWPDAWGAGGDFAIGAMEAGADALGAATIAVKRSTGCGGFVTVWFTTHPEGPAHERCICDNCHAHFVTLETKALADCATKAEATAGEGVDAPARFDDQGRMIVTRAEMLGHSHVVYSDLIGDRREHVHSMSNVDGTPFEELRTTKCPSELSAKATLRGLLANYLADVPGDIHWRIKPEVESDKEGWWGYARLVCIEQPWQERVAERERQYAEKVDPRIAQSHTAASGLRLHMEKMAAVASRAQPRCDHGYLSHTCSTCAPEARQLLELALRPNGRG